MKNPQSEAPAFPIDKIASLLTSGLGLETIRGACVEKLFIAPEDLDAAIAAATERLGLAADYDPIFEKGRAITRLEDLYNRAIGVEDIKTALAAEKTRQRLLGLDAIDAAAEPPDGEEPSNPPLDSARAKQSRSELHDAIDLHLEPLSPPLTDEPDATYADLIRLAAEEIVALRKRKGTGKAKAAASVRSTKAAASTSKT